MTGPLPVSSPPPAVLAEVSSLPFSIWLQAPPPYVVFLVLQENKNIGDQDVFTFTPYPLLSPRKHQLLYGLPHCPAAENMPGRALACGALNSSRHPALLPTPPTLLGLFSTPPQLLDTLQPLVRLSLLQFHLRDPVQLAPRTFRLKSLSPFPLHPVRWHQVRTPLQPSPLNVPAHEGARGLRHPLLFRRIIYFQQPLLQSLIFLKMLPPARPWELQTHTVSPRDWPQMQLFMRPKMPPAQCPGMRLSPSNLSPAGLTTDLLG